MARAQRSTLCRRPDFGLLNFCLFLTKSASVSFFCLVMRLLLRQKSGVTEGTTSNFRLPVSRADWSLSLPVFFLRDNTPSTRLLVELYARVGSRRIPCCAFLPNSLKLLHLTGRLCLDKRSVIP